MRIYTDEACLTYERPGHPESPQRVGDTLRVLRAEKLEVEWCAPTAVDDETLRRVHGAEHLEGLDREDDFDLDTPALPGIAGHARAAVGGALGAMESALAGEPAFSLLRPPGHHACPERAMGFCYLNQVAVCAVAAAASGRRVAVLDFDVHHGNGTEMVLLGRPETAYFSIHQSPAYPGTGSVSRLNCKNYPMAPETPRDEYVDGFKLAFEDLVEFRPDVVAVSAGFDAYRGDPLAQERVEADDYEMLGRLLRESGLPVFSVLEGGYSRDLPYLVLAYLRGLGA